MTARRTRSRESLAMRFDHARIRGDRIRYAVRSGDPARAPLLILNGIGANIELIAPFVDALPAPPIVTFDVPGVGGSPTPASPYRPSGVARLAEGLLDHLGYPDGTGASVGALQDGHAQTISRQGACTPDRR